MPDENLRALLARPADAVAPRLLGAVLSVGDCALRLTEVEAYLAADDPACHAAGIAPARRAEIAARAAADPRDFWREVGMPRAAPMFGPAGMVYVYFTYGMHFCANLVTGPIGSPEAVLLRAGEPVRGLEKMISRRGPGKKIAAGPAMLCEALGLGRGENGQILGEKIHLEIPADPLPGRAGPRIGIRAGTDLPLRWVAAAGPIG